MNNDDVIQRIKAHMAAMGLDVSPLDDDEIQKGVLEFGRVAGMYGLSLEECIDALARFAMDEDGE